MIPIRIALGTGVCEKKAESAVCGNAQLLCPFPPYGQCWEMMSPTSSQLSAFFLRGPRARGLCNQHWTVRGVGERTYVTPMLDQLFFRKHRSQNIFHINFSNCYQGQNATISSWSNARCEGFCICGDVCDWLMLACTYISKPQCSRIGWLLFWAHKRDDVKTMSKRSSRAYAQSQRSRSCWSLLHWGRKEGIARPTS